MTGRATTPRRTTRSSVRSGDRADAMSLALRSVHQRADDHADEMEQLLEDRADLETRRGQAVQRDRRTCRSGHRRRDRGGGAGDARARRATLCQPGLRRARRGASPPWQKRVTGPGAADGRGLQPGRDRRAGREAATAGWPTRPTSRCSRPPAGRHARSEVNAWWDGLTRERAAGDHRRPRPGCDRQPRRHPRLGARPRPTETSIDPRPARPGSCSRRTAPSPTTSDLAGERPRRRRTRWTTPASAHRPGHR